MNKPKGKLFTILAAFLVITLAGFGLSAAESTEEQVANVTVGSSGIYFVPNVSYQSLIISVSGPDGFVARKTVTGSNPYFGLSEFNGGNCPDGKYSYEMRVIPFAGSKKLRTQKAAVEPIQRARVQAGHFTVQAGSILLSQGNEGIARTQDVLHYDDVIITGSLCIGFDCANGESFGYDTLKLKENNLRFYYEDTSVGSFPSGDWRVQINDTTSGGASYYSVQDATAGRRVFTLEAGAPTHSLYVEDYGRVGLGTSIPYVELHIVDGDSPTIRLDQDGSSGWTAQRWDLCGNETNFFVRDVTNGSKLCFRIQPNTPSNTLCMRSSGYVGFGTWSPEYPMELETTGENAHFQLQRTDGVTFKINASTAQGQMGTYSNHKFNLVTNNTNRITIEEGGDIGLGLTNPSYLLHLNGGAYCDGGAWVEGSSREYKENISPVSLSDAVAALKVLDPVKFNYKKNPGEDYLGFIAEDVPEIVATKERKGINTMDVVAVLTKVVQEQQKAIAQLKKEISELKK